MTKLLKKLSIFTTTAFLFLLATTSSTTPLLPLPGIPVENPTENKPETKPMADDDDDDENGEQCFIY